MFYNPTPRQHLNAVSTMTKQQKYVSIYTNIYIWRHIIWRHIFIVLSFLQFKFQDFSELITTTLTKTQSARLPCWQFDCNLRKFDDFVN